ncbi:MAG: arginine--tRNA ligase [Rickettsiales bacterium]|jgi:arginyl-tRNA synthetase|nr:arginine--tRNA ligase [Rickettsiales bacterium]
MNIFYQLKQEVNNIAQNLFSCKPNQKQLSIEIPKNPDHGDLSTNIAMLLAKSLSKKPMEIAELIKNELEKLDYVDQANIAKPGFINLNLTAKSWISSLEDIIKQDINFGDNNIGKGENINIEFLSTNPTGPMHIGHSRCAIYGDALAKLMKKCGYKVTKEYYINDAGAQIDVLAKSAYLRYLEASGEEIGEVPEGLYPGDYLIPIGQDLFKKYGHGLKDMELIKEFTVNSMMELIKQDLKLLKVEYDVFFSEKTLHKQNKIDEIVKFLEEKNLVYRGILTPPKGKLPDDWEEREQLLFRTTDFGDDIDRPLQKSNGDWTYAAADLAYMKNKIERGFKKITMVLGADHLGYKKRMQAAALSIGGKEIDFDIKFCQLVSFLKNGQPFKMSKRAGTFISVNDVLEEVDQNIVRFVMLTRRNDQVLDFDFEKVKEQSKDNPVFYVQYANARVNSILKNAKERNKEYIEKINDKKYNLSNLDSHEDFKLIKLMSSWTKIVEQACVHQEPHRLVFFLIELASEFHSFWSKGNDNSDLRFIIENNFEKTLARLMLAKSVSIIIRSGLEVLNITPVDNM